MGAVNTADILDFDPGRYPEWGKFILEEKKVELWLCPCCLSEMDNFFDYCETKGCSQARKEEPVILH